MPLETGRKLGPYEVISQIGKGGMGEVYRARDTKLDRDVAIKVLPEELASDEERVARFEREAKLLASLNHPNIAGIYGFEENAIVLELIEGTTLAERIEQGPIPVDEAIAIATQIAEALEAGHEAGVIHRDLKPANIKVREDGTVKVLDYGLAKALEGDAPTDTDSELSQSPTLTRQGTQIGVILGTAAYMSPEQAKGKRVDKRADIWAFGAVVFEMLTGHKPFGGDSVSETLASVIKSEPDWSSLPSDVSPRVRELLRRCSTKDPVQRLRDIGDARLELMDDQSPPPDTVAPDPAGERRVPSYVIAIASALLAGVVVWSSKPSIDTGALTRVSVNLPIEHELHFGVDRTAPPFAISPDGRTIAYVAVESGVRRLFLRPLEARESEAIPGTEDAIGPFFSPDGGSVGFFADGALRKVSLSNRVSVLVSPAPGQPRGASWSDDDTIVFTSGEQTRLMRVSADGGEAEPLTTFDAATHELDHLWPDAIGNSVLYTIRYGRDKGYALGVVDLTTGASKIVVDGVRDARATPEGYLLYRQDRQGGRLFAAPYDVRESTITGPAVPVSGRVHRSPGGGATFFDVSDSGTLVYAAIPVGDLVWVDRRGRVETLGTERRIYSRVRLSPDGTKVAYGGGGSWILDLERGTVQRFHETASFPVWRPGRNEITVFDVQDGVEQLFSVSTDGGGEATNLLESAVPQVPSSWSPDGNTLLFYQIDPETQSDIWALREDGTAAPFLATDASEANPSFSPDGKYVVYDSDETGVREIYVRDYPSGESTRIVSSGGGHEPLWSPDGTEIFYKNGSHMTAVQVETASGFRSSKPTTLFRAPTAWGASIYDITPDGERFIMARADDAAFRELHVVLNWHEALRRLVSVDD